MRERSSGGVSPLPSETRTGGAALGEGGGRGSDEMRDSIRRLLALPGFDAQRELRKKQVGEMTTATIIYDYIN